MKKLKQENAEFLGKWKEERKITFKKFYIQKAIRVFVFMFLLYVFDYLIEPKFDYKMALIIYLGIVFAMPVFAWFVNETRYYCSQ